jgi:hypothetical protein
MKFQFIIAVLSFTYSLAETCQNVIAQNDDTTPCTGNGVPSEANLNPFCFSNGIRAGIMRPCNNANDKARTFAVAGDSDTNGPGPSCIHSCSEAVKKKCNGETECLDLTNGERGQCESFCLKNAEPFVEAKKNGQDPTKVVLNGAGGNTGAAAGNTGAGAGNDAGAVGNTGAAAGNGGAGAGNDAGAVGNTGAAAGNGGTGAGNDAGAVGNTGAAAGNGATGAQLVGNNAGAPAPIAASPSSPQKCVIVTVTAAP